MNRSTIFYVIFALAVSVALPLYYMQSQQYFPGLRIASELFGLLPMITLVIFGSVTIVLVALRRTSPNAALGLIVIVRTMLYSAPNIRFGFPIGNDPYYYLASIQNIAVSGHFSPIAQQLLSQGLVPQTGYQYYPISSITFTIFSRVLGFNQELTLRFIPPLLTMPLLLIVYLLTKELTESPQYGVYSALIFSLVDAFFLTDQIHDLALYYTLIGLFIFSITNLNRKSLILAFVLIFAIIFEYIVGMLPIFLPLIGLSFIGYLATKSRRISSLLRFNNLIDNRALQYFVLGSIGALASFYIGFASGSLTFVLKNLFGTLGQPEITLVGSNSIQPLSVSLKVILIVIIIIGFMLAHRSWNERYSRLMFWVFFITIEALFGEFALSGNPDRFYPIFFIISIPVSLGAIELLSKQNTRIAIPVVLFLFLLSTLAFFQSTSYIMNPAVSPQSRSNPNFAFSNLDVTAVSFVGHKLSVNCRVNGRILYDPREAAMAMYFGGLPPKFTQLKDPIFADTLHSNYSLFLGINILLLEMGLQSYGYLNLNKTSLMPFFNQPTWDLVYSNGAYNSYLNKALFC